MTILVAGIPVDAKLAHAFERVVNAAVAGVRCPINDDLQVPAGAFVEIARAGHIEIIVAGKNWRVVRILTGDHAGKSTAPCPNGAVYRVIGKTDRRVL